ncbi:MoxR family ATPase [Amycolatopsis sp. Hca4]|uniref:AAA family ATPase n=1 Tax=Amycolatopsis sp. Hca4 TaxID=2742131 RepID=UPI00159151BC|nr:MoxR family ATPase [Amycolatopsis sp. Hca4]QKV79939.1 MoxR family ATPase [Amycolatopsis sp. Hca4]
MTEGPLERAGRHYRPSEELLLAVKIARAAERPLLLYGEPGSGKSSLARYIAATGRCRYYELVTTARTQAADLLWSFDSVRRLGDAQHEGVGKNSDYVVPGMLWWAFDRDSAGKLSAQEPFSEWNSGVPDAPAVLLIDEIDKADPDMPNGLLTPLADRRFTVPDIDGGHKVQERARKPEARCLVVVTSNRERDLPPAFERRCVVLRLPGHTDEELRDIVKRHFGTTAPPPDLIEDLLRRLRSAIEIAGQKSRRAPSTAEFLDAVRACVQSGDVALNRNLLAKMIFNKDPEEPDRTAVGR